MPKPFSRIVTKVIGRYTVYRITGKGLQTLQPQPQVEGVLLKHLTDYVLKRLEDRGLLEQHEVDRKELSEGIQKHAQKLLKEIVESVEKSIREGE